MTTKKITIGIVAGEHSGDILGEGLIKALKHQYQTEIANSNALPNEQVELEFVGIGGPRMNALGCRSLFAMEELAVMGLVEVLSRLPRLLSVRKQLVKYFTENPPDVFIGIDAPDFNLGLELKLKQQGIKTVHYVSPSVWAWRQKRIFKIAEATNLVLALLPFEKAFYDKYQVPCEFVGHTLADDIPLIPNTLAYRHELSLPTKARILAVLPGSRGSEISMLASPFFAAIEQLQRNDAELVVAVPCVDEHKKSMVMQIQQLVAPSLKVHYFIGQSREVMGAADGILLASGTATLEAMLLKKPMVVAYKFKWLSFQIFKRLVKARFFSLPNLLADKALVPELLQDEVNTEQLVSSVNQMLSSDSSELVTHYTQLHQTIKLDASKKSAEAVYALLSNN
ncbi:lipid-A-disaccharide synthase [Flocculibacter collagenilyticus]|uniref:lipid-A-disaccharide synthase n=1 Tax=Flocculibacter collagenilyticus TaxID=2744479 RepID=UPI0018F6039C|nr:lipid-A-disaccharide synthase [Flocculibacter collagenilyticus]